MKKLLSFVVLLAIGSTLSFGQNSIISPSSNNRIQADDFKNLDSYFHQNVTSSSSKATLLSEGFEATTFPPTGWTRQNFTTQSSLQWTRGTSTTAPIHTGAGSAFLNSDQNGVIRDEWLISPVLNLTTAVNPRLSFWYELSYYWSVNPYDSYDFKVKISLDGGTTWSTAWTEDSIVPKTFPSFSWKQQYIDLRPYATATNFKFAFEYVGKPSSSSNPANVSAAAYIDDILVDGAQNNQISVLRTTLHDGLTKIPLGLARNEYFDTELINSGIKTQNHLMLHGTIFGTGIDSADIDTNLAAYNSLYYVNTTSAYAIWPSGVFALPNAVGTYKVNAFISTDSIPHMALDTLTQNVVCDTCMLSYDNNTYVSSRWANANTTTLQSNPFTAANRLQINAIKMIYGINFCVNLATKAGSKVRVVIYQYQAATQSRVNVAQSTYYYIGANKIPIASPTVNPPSISLKLNNPYQMQKDSLYFIGVEVAGGTDTVKLATDNTGIPQWEQTSQYFDPTANTWYIWVSGNVPAVMIRGIFNQNYMSWDNIVGVNEVNKPVNLFSCMPNPANSTTKIAYDLMNNENVSIIITDITGRIVRNINQGMQSKGNHSIDVDLSTFTSGTYFYTLKTPTYQATDKLIVVRR